MTGKILNLAKARKAKARDAKRRQADANAAKHGRTKSERAADTADQQRAARELDGHKREDD